jgi:hypothetical protein
MLFWNKWRKGITATQFEAVFRRNKIISSYIPIE